MTATGLSLEGVFIRLGDRVLIPPLTCSVAPGEVTTVMGPSGCGKSSLLAYICGTLDPAFTAGGRVRLGDVEIADLPPERRRIGILFQDDLLFPHMTVAENLAFGLPLAVRGQRERHARIDAALLEVGLAGFSDRDPSTLSGGQRARVALLRTLLSEPQALLLDEAFGRLDLRLRARFRRTVLDHARSRRLPTLLVTHDPEDAAAAGGPVIEIAIAEDPNPESYSAPTAQPVAIPLRRRP
jgi:putative thiamine transport system ATP-binding protein